MMTDFPREDLIRMSTVIRAESDDEGNRTLIGTPVVFDQWTEINGWEGRFKERIAAGAADKTLAERGDKIKVLFNHGMDPSIGDKPLGKPAVQDARDDALHVEVPFSDTSYNRDLIALLDDGALDGMSFRFGVIAEEWENLDDDDGGLPERTITELRMYEYGPVTFPAYEATTVGIRSRTEFEEYRTRQAAIQISKPDPAPVGRSADNDPAPCPPFSTQPGRAKRVRDIKLRLKGIKNDS